MHFLLASMRNPLDIGAILLLIALACVWKDSAPRFAACAALAGAGMAAWEFKVAINPYAGIQVLGAGVLLIVALITSMIWVLEVIHGKDPHPWRTPAVSVIAGAADALCIGLPHVILGTLGVGAFGMLFLLAAIVLMVKKSADRLVAVLGLAGAGMVAWAVGAILVPYARFRVGGISALLAVDAVFAVILFFEVAKGRSPHPWRTPVTAMILGVAMALTIGVGGHAANIGHLSKPVVTGFYQATHAGHGSNRHKH